MKRLSLLVFLCLLSFQAFAKSAATEEEINCLALNIYFEARSESHEGQLAVAYVTMNRVANPNFPKTVCEVVWQPRQFSWTHDGKSDNPVESVAWHKAKAMAKFIYANYPRFMKISRGSADVTRGALYYYSSKLTNPVWARTMVALVEIGDHVFLVEES